MIALIIAHSRARCRLPHSAEVHAKDGESEYGCSSRRKVSGCKYRYGGVTPPRLCAELNQQYGAKETVNLCLV
jgi:hypothetical protein